MVGQSIPAQTPDMLVPSICEPRFATRRVSASSLSLRQQKKHPFGCFFYDLFQVFFDDGDEVLQNEVDLFVGQFGVEGKGNFIFKHLVSVGEILDVKA